MYKLTVFQGQHKWELEFEGETRLAELLADAGIAIAKPCGGRGSCGKCAVRLAGAISEANNAEQRAGTRLICQATLLGDAQAILPEGRALAQIEFDGVQVLKGNPMSGRLGAAVDIGTTTIALRLYDLKSGACIAQAGMANPQNSLAADVMGRIEAAMNGRLRQLQMQVNAAVLELGKNACSRAERSWEEVDAMTFAGNTTMLYLLTGRDPKSLSCAPFEADCLFDETAEILGKRAYLPPCMNAFVGADIACAVLAAGQCRDGVSLLADIGTNGEIALWKDGVLYVSSTAAGPAFEGAGISCGSGSVIGAIDRVWLEKGKIEAHTIGEERAAGVCGSGLIDAVACFLENAMVDETGATDAEALPLRDGVALQPRDIRAVQLAKAAIAAGIETLMETAGVNVDEIETFYIAGGFGSRLNVKSAVRIGLISPKLVGKVKVLGNAALAGAAQIMLDQKQLMEIRSIAARAKHVNLGGNPRFNEHYMDQMFFPEE